MAVVALETKMTRFIILLMISLPFMLSIGKICNTSDLCLGLCCVPVAILELIGGCILLVDRGNYAHSD